MSDTDKTKPYWVKLWQNPELRREVHYHEKGLCDLSLDDILDRTSGFSYRFRHCYYDDPYGYCESVKRIYVQHRARSRKRGYVDEWNGHERARWRSTMHELRKMSLEDVKDSDFQNFAHRHSALWDAC